MKRYKLFVIGLLLLTPSKVVKAAKPDYQCSDSMKVVKLLKQASQQDSSVNYMIYFARQLCGVPYVGKTLEKNCTERLVVNLRELDCSTYVESVLALTMCARKGEMSFEDFCHNLQQVRYQDGDIHYTNRLHYFTHWMNENVRKGIVKYVEGHHELFSATQTVKANYMTIHVSLYPMLMKHKEWIPDIRKMEKAITGNKYAYIPKSNLGDSKLLRQTIHDGDIIAILTSRHGLDTSHLGIAIWHTDGLHLLNASSIHHKVVEEPKLLKTYMAEQRTQIGIRVVRPL
jgi:hypothetical protein